MKAIFLIMLIVMMPLALAQDGTTGSIPINADIPEYATSERIDITGTTDPQTKINLFVNGVRQRKFDPEETGMFSFASVELSVFTIPNVIVIEAEKGGIKSQKTYNVIVDNVMPEITLDKIEGLSSKEEIRVKGSVSELVQLDIKLNNDTIHSLAQVDAFDKILILNEGDNELIVIAEDKAGNRKVVSQNIMMDSTPPDITEITPRTGAFFYETDPITDIEGKTEPNSKVFLYVDKKPEGKADDETKSDTNGNFKFEDVNIEGGYAIAGRAGYIGISGSVDEDRGREYLPVDPQDVEEEADIPAKQDKELRDIYILVEDPVGLRSQERLTYTLGTCFSGRNDWAVLNLVEYQSPNTLSPERLAEGTEVATFILNLSYQGGGSKAKIKDVKFERACDATAVQDERYKQGCKVLPTSSIRKGNDAKTTWYIRYNLNQLEGMDNFSEDLWKDLTKQFILPLKLRIDYSHEVDGKEKPGFQTQCMNLAYHVDTSRVDPRDVLPDWLLDEGQEFINESITKLNDIIPTVEKIMRYAGIACIVGFGLKVITTIYRRWQGWMNYLQDRTDINKNEDQKCPKPGRIYDSTHKGDQITQADLSNSELKTRCPSVDAAWEAEINAFKAFRWSCDRFLCHGTPARWTEASSGPVQARVVSNKEDTVWEQIRNGLQCEQKTGTKGAILKRDLECTQAAKQVCWVYDGKHYVRNLGRPPSQEGDQLYYFLHEVNPKTGDVEGTLAKDLKVLKDKNTVMLEEPQTKGCKKICNEKEFKTGRCIDPADIQDVAKDTTRGRPFVNTEECIATQEICYCYDEKSDTEKKLEKDTQGKWSYRYDKIKRVAYSDYLYYEDRDQSACFGQNNWIFAGSPYLDPADTIPAFQCACTSQIRNRFVLLRNILLGLHNCMKQIETTGRADVGVCKEIFTQYVCKWASRLITYFAQGCVPFRGTDGQTDVGDFIQAGTDSIFGGIEEATDDLLGEYDNVALRDYLGLNQHTVAEKICLFAITGDWGFNFEGLLDAAYATPFHTSATAFPADREYLTWNPDNQQATYEYRAAWMIAPGCEIDSYSVNLACVTDYELNTFDGVACDVDRGIGDDLSDSCDCTSLSNSQIEQSQVGPTALMERGRNLPQGVFVDQSKHVVKEAPYRYDHIKIQLNVNDPKLAEACFPKSNLINQRSAVFYTPIHDATTKDILACRFNPTLGSFVCDQSQLLWDLRGRASFGEIDVPKTVYMGEDFKINKISTRVSGKKQCLYVDLRNEFGEVVGKPVYETLNVDDQEPTKTQILPIEEYVVVPEILPEHFGRYSDSLKISSDEKNPDRGVRYRRIETEDGVVRTGTYDVYFKDESNDGKEIGTHIKIGSTWDELSPQIYRIPENGMAFTFTRPEVSEDSRCEGEGGVPCKKYTFRITKGQARTVVNKQEWTLHLELRHAPGESNEGLCTDSVKDDMLSERNIEVTAYPYTEDAAQICKNRDGFRMNRLQCDCNQDGATTDIIDCTGDVNENGKIDVDETGYCYKDKCTAVNRCYTGTTQNSIACDCDGDGRLDEACKNAYCWTNGKCNATSQPKSEIDKATTPRPSIVEIRLFYKEPGFATKEKVMSDTEVFTVDPDTEFSFRILAEGEEVKIDVKNKAGEVYSVKEDQVLDFKTKTDYSEEFIITVRDKLRRETSPFSFTIKT